MFYNFSDVSLDDQGSCIRDMEEGAAILGCEDLSSWAEVVGDVIIHYGIEDLGLEFFQNLLVYYKEVSIECVWDHGFLEVALLYCCVNLRNSDVARHVV